MSEMIAAAGLVVDNGNETGCAGTECVLCCSVSDSTRGDWRDGSGSVVRSPFYLSGISRIFLKIEIVLIVGVAFAIGIFRNSWASEAKSEGH